MPVDIFEQFSDEYEQWFIQHHDEYAQELSQIKQVIGDISYPALEIGVGSGRFAEPLGIMHGIEPSYSLGLMAKERGIEVIRGRGESLPVKSHTYHMVVMITVLCFLEKPEDTFQEVHRILAHTGKLAVAFIERDGKIAHRYLSRPDKGRFLSQARFYSLDEAITMISSPGFTLISTDCRLGFCTLLFQKRE